MPSLLKSPTAVCLSLTRAIDKTRTLDEIYDAALDALAYGLGVERASILLFDADGVMRFKAVARHVRRLPPRGRGPHAVDAGRRRPGADRGRATSPRTRRCAAYLPTIQRRGHRGDGVHPAGQPWPGDRQVHALLRRSRARRTSTSCSWPRDRRAGGLCRRADARRGAGAAQRGAAALRARRGVDGHVGLGPAHQEVQWSDNLAADPRRCPPAPSTARSPATSARSIPTIASACSPRCSAR